MRSRRLLGRVGRPLNLDVRSHKQMAVSLFDTMRPMALACGLGAAWGTASTHSVGAVGHVALVIGALVVGALAIWISQHMVRRLDPWVAAHQGSSRLELWLGGFYVAVFVAIAVASYGGGLCGRILAAI
jgi:hypothetical protein